MINIKIGIQTTFKLVMLLLLSQLLFFNCKNDGQELKGDANEFKVIIKTDIDTDSLSMYPNVVPEDFLDSSYTSLYKGYLKNGTVSFTDKKLPHPYMFDILDERNGFSKKFFADNGVTEVFFDYQNEPNINTPTKFKSRTQIEYEELKALGLKEIDSLCKILSNSKELDAILRLKRDSVIVSYVRKNPKSYVPLWLMANYVTYSDKYYNKLYDESLELFSEDIKKTELFKRLKSYIVDTRETSIANKLLPLKNLNLEPISFKLNDIKNKEYILLDFWYSNCGPCLREMPKYVPLYEKYKDLGFEIVSISVDQTSKIQDWKDVIKERNFNWIHYLDENRKLATKLKVLSFPTTFLIDKKGDIVEKNISANKLQNLLIAELNK